MALDTRSDMMKIARITLVALAAFFIVCSAQAQNSGTATNHAFAIGKGPGQTGFTSLLCASAQLAVGQTAADPICRTISGDVTIDASGVTAIGSNKVTLGMLATLTADSFIGNLTGSAATPGAYTFPNCPSALIYSTATHTLGCSAMAGTGTVTDVTCGTGLSGGVIIGSGTCSITAPIPTNLGGTGVVSPTAHTIPINEGSSAQSNTGTGTLGQALTSNGAGVDPSFKSGGWTLLNTLTASSSATLSDTTNITSSYREYLIEFENLVPATNSVTANLQVYSGGSFQTTGYISSIMYSSSTAVAASGQTTAVFLSTPSNISSTASVGGTSGYVQLSNPSGTSFPKHIFGIGVDVNGGTSIAYPHTTGGMWNNTAAITGFQILMSSGNIATGVVRLYGRN